MSSDTRAPPSKQTPCRALGYLGFGPMERFGGSGGGCRRVTGAGRAGSQRSCSDLSRENRPGDETQTLHLPAKTL